MKNRVLCSLLFLCLPSILFSAESDTQRKLIFELKTYIAYDFNIKNNVPNSDSLTERQKMLADYFKTNATSLNAIVEYFYSNKLPSRFATVALFADVYQVSYASVEGQKNYFFLADGSYTCASVVPIEYKKCT